MNVEDRQKDADPHGRAVDERVVLNPCDFNHLSIGRGNQQSRPAGHDPQRIADAAMECVRYGE